MAQTLLIENLLGQTRVAAIEDGALCEFYVERPDSENLTGNIYLGRVENVIPGMNAAFVNIGLDKNAFLGAQATLPEYAAEGERGAQSEAPRIERLVRPGQTLAVQVIRSMGGDKGPQISTSLSLTGRQMVLLPDTRYVGVSKKIAEKGERERLRGLGMAWMDETGHGMILRTAAENAPEDALLREYRALCDRYASLRTRADHDAAPGLLYSANALTDRVMREMLRPDTDALWVEGEALHRELLSLADIFAPGLRDRIRLHTGQIPLFDLYSVDAQVDKALSRHVWLKSGGSLVIEQAEALTIVDVNTAKFTGKRTAEETLLTTNLEAAREIMRQIRLRDLSGIIIADFINLSRESDQKALMDELRACAKLDRNRTRVVDITPLGLVEITRKRERLPLSAQLTHTCDGCGGSGRVPSHETTARRALRDVWRRRRGGEDSALIVEASAPVCGWMRKLGAPEGGALYLRVRANAEAGEYAVVPASGVPTDDCTRLK